MKGEIYTKLIESNRLIRIYILHIKKGLHENYESFVMKYSRNLTQKCLWKSMKLKNEANQQVLQ